VESAPAQSGPRLVRLNAELKAARYSGAGAIEFSYRSSARAIAILDRVPHSIEVDGVAIPAAKSVMLLLPRGQHVVTISAN
jgi:hypothetical protein